MKKRGKDTEKKKERKERKKDETEHKKREREDRREKKNKQREKHGSTREEEEKVAATLRYTQSSRLPRFSKRKGHGVVLEASSRSIYRMASAQVSERGRGRRGRLKRNEDFLFFCISYFCVRSSLFVLDAKTK